MQVSARHSTHHNTAYSQEHNVQCMVCGIALLIAKSTMPHTIHCTLSCCINGPV